VADLAPGIPVARLPTGASTAWEFARATFRPPLAKLGGVLLLGFVVLALVGLVWNPGAGDPSVDLRQGPSLEHPLGTDSLGRDVATRLVAGSFRIIGISAAAAITTIVLGGGLGALLAFRGGLVDQAVMRGLDILLSFPVILVALLAAALLPTGYLSLYLVVVLLFVPPIARVARAIFAEQFARDYVTAASLRGESAPSIIVREVLPNATGPLLVEFALRWNYAVILIASLNFLGVGVQPPTPDWGVMVYEARGDLTVAPWAAVSPAVALAALAVAINFTADGLSNAIARRSAGTRRL
jgi:peptide/nickel transport system permease protein